MNAPANPFEGKRICMVAPYMPRKGGVTVQTHLLVDALESSGAIVERVDTIYHGLPGPLLAPLRIIIQGAKTKLGFFRRAGGCDVTHVQGCSWWGFMPVLICVLANRLYPRRRIVVTYHGGEAASFMRRWGWIAGWVLRKADRVVAVSEPIQAVMGSYGINCELVHNLVDLQRFAFRERLQAQPHIVWLRYLEPTYDPLLALDVFERVKMQFPGATLSIVGDGSLRGEMERRIVERRLSDVKLAGRLAPEEVAAELDKADIFLNTSRADGAPTAILEAMTSGLVIVTTNAGGIPQLVQDGQEGTVREVGDIDGLFSAVVTLVRDPDTAATYSHQARLKAEEFGWEAVSRQIAKLYGFADGGNT